MTPLELPFVTHSATSIDAAESIKPHAATLRNEVLKYLRKQPATDEQIQEALAMAANTQRPRRRELELMGLVRDSGRTNKTRSGRRATIWEAV